MSVQNWISEQITRIRVGAPVSIANNGQPIDVVTIRYKEFYLFVDIDVKTGEPTGDFGWSRDPTMNPNVLIRDIWAACPPKAGILPISGRD